MGTVDGVADLGVALAAWFSDPHHHGIGLLQGKEPPQVAWPSATQEHLARRAIDSDRPVPDRRQVRHPRKETLS